jgi:uncharacterized sulfatase
MKKSGKVFKLIVIFSALAGASLVAAERPEKPNVILILTDDLGWQDVKCYDLDEPSPMETPNIDALAQKGVQFWQAYAPAPTCAPTRCAIMSGNHPARAQKTHVVGGAPPAPYSERNFRMMPPWYSGRMPADELTLAKVLQENGYRTGHCGKWHMAINHSAFPQPEDQGFDYTRSNLGTTARMRPNRLTGFATTAEDDRHRLDANGFPYHQNSVDALNFIEESKEQAFFLYYATWLVHTPIHTRSQALLDKYVKKLGVSLPENPEHWSGKGQTNPFYCAMVEELDYYMGQLFDYLEQTEDPRWPGHKLIENTYIIFTSDNGGMERVPNQIITDNYPLDRGKISAMEGGTRVPLIITGPGIAAGVQSEVMVNGLDFYPTILSLTDTKRPSGKELDGCDLSDLLLANAEDESRVREENGKIRDTMVWHFPHSVALESTIRIGDYKLVRNYDHVNNPASEELELYRLYKKTGGKVVRVDIEESRNLVTREPRRAAEMNDRLTEILEAMQASYPYYNPAFKGNLPNKEEVGEVLEAKAENGFAHFRYQENGVRVVRANLIYTLNGGAKYEEWYRKPAQLLPGEKGRVLLPPGTTHFYINLIDANNFLISYPAAMDMLTKNKSRRNYSEDAIPVVLK